MAHFARAVALVATSLHTAFYAPLWKAVVIPYVGRPPIYAVGRSANPPRVYVDVRGVYRVGTRWGRTPGNPLLADWSMAPHGGYARVTLTLRRPGGVRVFDNVRRHWLVLVPQAIVWSRPVARPHVAPKPHAKAVAHRPAGPVLGRADWDPWQRAIAIPYSGNAFPAYHLGTANHPPRVFVDFHAAGPRFPQKVAVKGQPGLLRFETASRGPKDTRVVLVFSHATPTRVENDRVRHEVLIVPQHAAVVHSSASHAAPHAQPPHSAPLATPTPTPAPAEQDPTLSAP